MPDHRSAKAREYRQHYATARWKAAREQQLRAEPLCRYCQERGIITAANVCHHIDPKTKDDPATFYSGPFASLCEPCHNGPAAREDNRGFSTATGLDGFPSDPKHPFNR